MLHVFEGIAVGCCMGREDACICDPTERVIRAYTADRYTGQMTPAQRAWCVAEAYRAGEGTWRREDLEALDDGDLAATVLDMWRQYCQGQGLL